MSGGPSHTQHGRRGAALVCAALGVASCDLALDIGSLDRGGSSSGTGGHDAGASPAVEVVAYGQCNPGDIAVADGYVYWTITQGGDPTCTQAIRRAPAAAGAGTPTDVVTSDVDGAGKNHRPWSLFVSGDTLYWLGCGAICSASASGQDQSCNVVLPVSYVCPSGNAMARSGSSLFFAGGCTGVCGATNTSPGGIWSYDLGDGGVSDAGPAYNGLGLAALAAGTTVPPKVAWIEPGCSGKQHVLYGNAGYVWDSCKDYPALDAQNVVTDTLDLFYWMAQTASGTYSLMVFDTGSVGTLVTGIFRPQGLALDTGYVYFTAQDGGGSVYAVSRHATTSVGIGALVPLATNRRHSVGAGPWNLAATDPTWLYWVVSAPDGTVERVPKPAP